MCQHQKKMQENDIFTDFTLESTSQRNRIEKNLVKVIFSWGLFKEKKLVELKFITSAPPYRLNNLEATIRDFVENSFRLF